MKTPRSKREYQLSIFRDGIKAWLGLAWGYPDRAFLFLRKEGIDMGERLPEYLEPGEIKKVLSIPDKRCKIGFRDYLILRLLVETGIRRGELAGMKIENLISHNGGYSLFFPSLKKRKVRGKESHKEKRINREIPLKTDLYQDLQRYLKQEYNGSNTDKDLPLFRTSGKQDLTKKLLLHPKPFMTW